MVVECVAACCLSLVFVVVLPELLLGSNNKESQRNIYATTGNAVLRQPSLFNEHFCFLLLIDHHVLSRYNTTWMIVSLS